jgi:FkbM family methyltransferase
MIVTKIFRVIHHYAHALEIRSILTLEYFRQRKLKATYPKNLLRSIRRQPGHMEDYIQLSRFIDEGDHILLIDIGGNTGDWAQSFIGVFPNSDIVAFEPDSRAAAEYLKRFFGKANAVVHQIALSNVAGIAELRRATSSTYSSLEEYLHETKQMSEGLDKVQVQTATLDGAGIKTTGFDKVIVKLDVQGHEAPVVEGGIELLRKANIVIVEVSFAHEFVGQEPSFSRVCALLREAGLYPIVFQDHGRSLSPYPWERDVIFVREEQMRNIWGW